MLDSAEIILEGHPRREQKLIPQWTWVQVIGSLDKYLMKNDAGDRGRYNFQKQCKSVPGPSSGDASAISTPGSPTSPLQGPSPNSTSDCQMHVANGWETGSYGEIIARYLVWWLNKTRKFKPALSRRECSFLTTVLGKSCPQMRQ